MKEKSLKIVIIILFIIILILGSYIFLDKIIDKDNDFYENNSEYPTEKEDDDLTIEDFDYQEFFEDAEELYAEFTGYLEPDLNISNSIKENDNNYYLVTDSAFKNMDTLKNELTKYFDIEIVNKLLDTKVNGKYPLYVEASGRIYRFGGFVGQYGYDMCKSNLSIVDKTNDRFTLHNKIVFDFDDDAMESSGIYEFDYYLEKDLDGNFKFTNFELPVSFYNNIIN